MRIFLHPLIHLKCISLATVFGKVSFHVYVDRENYLGQALKGETGKALCVQAKLLLSQ